MADIPDFRSTVKPMDAGTVATILQRKREIENQQNQQALDNYNNRMKRITDAITTGQQVASNMMTLAEKRNQMEGRKELTGLITTPPPTPPTPTASSTALPQAGNFPVMPSPDQTGQYEMQVDARKKALMAALIKANPDDVTKELASAQFSKPDKAPNPAFQTKAITHNGIPKEALFDPDPNNPGYYDAVTHERLTGEITPYGMSSPTAEIRRQALRDRQTENLGKDLNELAINSNSPAGISAKRTLYAQSGLNLIKQTEDQPGGADKRQMAELQMEVARVLTGQGVITNEQINSLATKSGMSKVKNWEEWLTNTPTGIEQQEFIHRFKDTLERQAKFHGRELDKYKQKSMAKYTTFEKQAPEEFFASLEQAGYDPEKYRKTRKLVPLADMNPPELDEIKERVLPSKPALDSFFK